MHSWRRFFSALVLAPLAGGVAGFIAGLIFVLFIGKESEQNWTDATMVGSTLGFWALLISLAYVLVVGSAAFVYARARQRTLSLGLAFSVAFLTGAVPFTYISFRKEVLPQALLLPAFALICAFATAWTFWRVAFAESHAS
jgi:hypothetical protein